MLHRVLEEAIRLPGESPAYMIVLNSQRGESIDIVCGFGR